MTQHADLRSIGHLEYITVTSKLSMTYDLPDITSLNHVNNLASAGPESSAGNGIKSQRSFHRLHFLDLHLSHCQLAEFNLPGAHWH